MRSREAVETSVYEEKTEKGVKRTNDKSGRSYLGQFSQMIGVQEQFFETLAESHDFVRYVGQAAMTAVDVLDVTTALEQWHASKHDCGRSVQGQLDERPRFDSEELDLQ
jgi:hypothetical protein